MPNEDPVPQRGRITEAERKLDVMRWRKLAKVAGKSIQRLRCLPICIGGPLDGRPATALSSFTAYPVLPPNATPADYAKATPTRYVVSTIKKMCVNRVKSKSSTVIFRYFRPETMSERDALEMLVSGYRDARAQTGPATPPMFGGEKPAEKEGEAPVDDSGQEA